MSRAQPFLAMRCEGIVITDAASNIIGGATAAQRNLISGNNTSVTDGAAGIAIIGASAQNNTVQGNYIGTNAAGTLALANAREGVYVNAPNNTIGGPTATAGQGAGNLISGNTRQGVRLGTFFGNTTTGNKVLGNIIGLNAAGTGALPNQLDGVSVDSAANGNSIRVNRIANNGGLGIDLADNGVTANDAGDGDTGANNLQNYPVLALATQSAAGQPLIVNGSLNSTRRTHFHR